MIGPFQLNYSVISDQQSLIQIFFLNVKQLHDSNSASRILLSCLPVCSLPSQSYISLLLSIDQDDRINNLRNEANDIRTRLSAFDPANSTLPPGQQPATNNYGFQRQIADAQNTMGDQLQNLESEKISLMKRLNMVLSELEKATHEKSDISTKLRQQERMADELRHKLEEMTSLKNVVNRNMQEEILYEREVNTKLQDDLSRFEKEKESLLGRLREEEDLSDQIAKETNTINNSLQQRTDDLRRLELEHDHTSRRLKTLTDELESLRGQEAKTRQQKVTMDQQLDELTHQRNDLIRKMNELSERYETYVSTMNRERQDICRSNKRQVKHLVAKLLGQILQDNITRKQKNAFLEIVSTSKQMANLESRLTKLTRIMGGYQENRKRHFLREWYRRALNVVHETSTRNNILDAKVKFKREQKFFYLWRQAYLNRIKNSRGREEGLRVLTTVLIKKQHKVLRHNLCKWRDYVELQQSRENFLYAVSQRKHERQLRLGFVTWLTHSKREALLEKYDKLSDMVTQTWFKQRVFLALKHACQKSQEENCMEKFSAWKTWCETAREQKYFANKVIIIDKIQGLRTERLIRKAFDAIRYGNMQQRFETTRDQLNERLPERQELEYRKDCIIKNTNTRTKAHVLRNCYLRQCDHAYRAVKIWKMYCVYHKHICNRINLLMKQKHNRYLRMAFMRWKADTDKLVHNDLIKVNEDCRNENQDLVNDLEKKTVQRDMQIQRAEEQQMSKLVRIRNMINRKHLRWAYDKWIKGAELRNGLERACEKMNKVEHKHKLRNNFYKWRAQAAAVKRWNFITTKCEWFNSQRNRNNTKDMWFTWLEYIRVHKLAKKFLKRAEVGMDRGQRSTAFYRWKQVIVNDTHQVYDNNIQELKSRQNVQTLEIARTKEEIVQAQSGKTYTVARMKDLSQRVMANFICRMVHMRVAQGFYTWLDATHNDNKRRRLLRKMSTFMKRKQTGQAFRHWANTQNHLKGEDLAMELVKQKDRQNALHRQGLIEADEQSTEQKRMKDELDQKVSERDNLQRGFDQAFKTYCDRMNNNVYIDRRRQIFLTWREYVKKERNAVNVIGAIARRTLRIEVFRRIRMTARENYLDSDAKRICTNFYRMFLQKQMGRAIVRWRAHTLDSAKTQLKESIQTQVETDQAQQQQMANIESHVQAKGDRVLNTKRLRKYNTALIEMIKFLKALRVKDEVFKKNILFLRSKRAMQHWNMRVQWTKTLRRRNEQVIKAWQQKVKARALKGWLSMNKEESVDLARMGRMISKMQHFDKAQAFQKWQQWTLAENEKDQQNSRNGTIQMTNVLQRLVLRRLAVNLHALRIRTSKKDYKRKYLKRMILHQSTYRLRYYFQRWSHKAKCYALADLVNTEGEVVMRRNELQRNAKALKSQLVKSGYEPEAIEQFVEERTEQQKANMNKAVISLFFKNSEFNVVPKAWNSWREFIAQRKRMKQAARFIINSMHHPLQGWLNKWKYNVADAQKKIDGMSKNQLINKIIADENLIGSTEQRISRMEEAIDHLAIQRETLLGHYIRGQKLAVALIKNNYLKTTFRAFLRWKRHSQEYENLKLIEQLERSNQMITELSAHVGKLESINRNLLTENEELRQAALDGIEIAKVVQELTKERESLSQDLADRSGTIKKLIQDNNDLAVRLNIAQKEAHQLENMNQQIHTTGQADPDYNSRY